MKKFPVAAIVAFAALIVWLAPLCAAVIDALCWFVRGSTCSAIQWDEVRPALVIFWTAFWAFPAWLVFVVLFSKPSERG